MATKKPRYMISVDDDMFNRIENFRFENRFQTRSEATAELIRLGLEALEKKQAEAKKDEIKQAEPQPKPTTIEELIKMQQARLREEAEDEHIPLPWEE